MHHRTIWPAALLGVTLILLGGCSRIRTGEDGPLVVLPGSAGNPQPANSLPGGEAAWAQPGPNAVQPNYGQITITAPRR